MGYAYEDDEVKHTDEEELDENLNVKKKSNKTTKSDDLEVPSKKSVKVEEEVVEVKKDLSIDDLLMNEDNPVLEDKPKDIYLADLISKSDEKLFSKFIGKNYEKIISKRFNIPAFILGPIYLFYRKVYSIALVWLFINLFVLCLFPFARISWIIIGIFEAASYIACGMYANNIILNHVGSRIMNFKLKGINKLQAECEKRGGTNLIGCIPLVLISSILIVYSGNYLLIDLKYNNNKLPNFKVEESTTFNGMVNMDTKDDITKKVSITIPDNFYAGNDLKYQYYYVYQNPDAYIPLCTIELEKVKGYKKPELFIKAIQEYHLDLPENIREIEKNGYNWYYIEVASGSKNIYYATTEIDKEMYLFKLMYDYRLENDCGSKFMETLESIK